MNLNKKIMTGIVVGILTICGITLVSVAGVKKKETAKLEIDKKLVQKLAPRPVRLERVAATDSARERSLPGIIKASAETALSFRVGGPLTEVNVVLGEQVKKGDVLMQIDPRDFKDRIASLEAQLSGVMAMQQNAQQNYKRIANLYKEKVAPQSDFDHTKSVLDSAKANVKGLNAQLQIAKHALADTSLVAPYDGTVTEQLIENHEMIGSGDIVLRFHNIQFLEVTVNVSENDVIQSSAQNGLNARVSFPAVPGKSFPASLKEWSSNADQITRTYGVTFEFAAPQELKVLPGMSATITIDDAQGETSVLAVPVSSLTPGVNGGSVLWIYDEKKGNAKKRNVTTGDLVGASRVVIQEGIFEGELVVLSGSRLIYENLPLKTASVR